MVPYHGSVVEAEYPALPFRRVPTLCQRSRPSLFACRKVVVFSDSAMQSSWPAWSLSPSLPGRSREVPVLRADHLPIPAMASAIDRRSCAALAAGAINASELPPLFLAEQTLHVVYGGPMHASSAWMVPHLQ